jgi:hypothetical protein
MTIERSPYLSTIAKKSPWQAVPVDKAQVLDGAEETLFKALALRHLEIPVKELLDEGMQRELPSTPGIVEALRSNQDDEDRHLEALNYVAAAHGTNDKAEREIMSILDAWNEHPAHPILKAGILERSIFFVALPFFRQTGDVGMRTVSQDISKDERVHVAINGMVSKELGEKESRKPWTSYVLLLLRGCLRSLEARPTSGWTKTFGCVNPRVCFGRAGQKSLRLCGQVGP